MSYKNKISTYLKSRRRGIAANNLEQEAMEDVFLNDALDGFAHTNDDKQSLADISRLQGMLNKRTQKRSNKSITRWIASSAAVLLVLATGYWFFQDNNHYSEKSELAVLDKSNVCDDNIAQDVTMEQKQDPIELNKSDKKNQENGQAHIVAQNNTNKSVENSSSSAQASNTSNNTQANNQTAVKVENKPEELPEKETPANASNPIEEGVLLAEQTDVKAPPLEKGSIVTNTPPHEGIATRAPAKKTGVVTPSSGGQYGFMGNNTPAKKKELDPADGMRRYERYLRENLVYPADAKKLKKEGKVSLTFLINEEGRPYDIKVDKSLCESCDNEAIRLVNEGGNWIPMSSNLQKRVKFKIEFKL